MSTVTIHWHYDGDQRSKRQTEIPAWASDDGEQAAAEVAEKAHEEDFEEFIDDRKAMPIIITEPEAISGRYEIYLEYVPYYTAYTTWSQIEEPRSGDTDGAEQRQDA